MTRLEAMSYIRKKYHSARLVKHITLPVEVVDGLLYPSSNLPQVTREMMKKK